MSYSFSFIIYLKWLFTLHLLILFFLMPGLVLLISIYLNSSKSVEGERFQIMEVNVLEIQKEDQKDQSFSIKQNYFFPGILLCLHVQEVLFFIFDIILFFLQFLYRNFIQSCKYSLFFLIVVFFRNTILIQWV